jgi:DnaJ like chaperone protein
MSKFMKWISGGLGWALFGPIGGLIGFAVGAIVDGTEITTGRATGPTTTGDFVVSLLVLVAGVMKADGKIMRSELDYVKAYFRQVFGEEGTREAMSMLRDLLKKDIPIEEVAVQISQRVDYSSRLQLLHFLYGIANADGHLDIRELETIQKIAYNMGISAQDMESLKSMFYKDTSSAYRVLEIEAGVTDDEVKKAYRQMAVKYHPDKVAYLGEDFRKAADEKFRKVNEAYETIKKERGMN